MQDDLLRAFVLATDRATTARADLDRVRRVFGASAAPHTEDAVIAAEAALNRERATLTRALKAAEEARDAR